MMEQEYKYMVCTRCFTFNHAPYIVDAMNGFTMQETSFPVITIIVDDASTDGEPDVIRQYLVENFQAPYRTEETDNYYLICANHTTNTNCEFVVLLLKYNHYSIKKSKFPYISEWRENSKYEALCEGDDHWINPHKLQLQVAYMDTHSSCGLCYCNYQILNEATGEYLAADTGPYEGFNELLKKNHIATLTTLFRSDLYFKYENDIHPSERNWKMGDYPFWLYIAANNDIHFIDEITSVYRLLPESASHSKDYKMRLAFQTSTRDVRFFYANKYALGDDMKRQINDVYWREQSIVLKGKDKKAYKEALRKIRNKTFKEYIKILLPCCFPFFR